MKGVLLRVGCDSTLKGGNWNAPIEMQSLQYAYVPIPAHEDSYQHMGDCPTYASFSTVVERFRVSLPRHLVPNAKVHLDPDFKSLTFGEPYHDNLGRLSTRGQILNQLGIGDFITFFAAFRPVGHNYSFPLAYCLFGILHIQLKTIVKGLSLEKRVRCAHGRRIGAENDLVIWGDPWGSGRFQKAIPIGEYKDRAYRVRQELLEEWGGLTVARGYLQRSARPPFFKAPEKFLNWLSTQEGSSSLIHSNW